MNSQQLIDYIRENMPGEEFAREDSSFNNSQVVNYEFPYSQIVVKRYFKDSNIYLRLTGFTSSYSDTHWDFDTLQEVFPKQKTITVFE